MSMIADVGNDGNRNSEGEGLDLLGGLAGAYVVPHKSSILWLLIQVYSCCDGIVTFFCYSGITLYIHKQIQYWGNHLRVYAVNTKMVDNKYGGSSDYDAICSLIAPDCSLQASYCSWELHRELMGCLSAPLPPIAGHQLLVGGVQMKALSVHLLSL